MTSASNETLGGVYNASAINTITGCTNAMLGTPTVTVNPLPTALVVTGGGGYCSGGTGVTVSIAGTNQVGVDYQLLLGGVPVVGAGALFHGDGSVNHSFGLQTTAGVYTVGATSTTGTGCTNTMLGSATVSINPLPAVYIITGGGTYCVGGTGVHVGLSSSATGMAYQLYNGGGSVGTAIAGTGSPIDFGLELASAGSYSVVATNTVTGCISNMANPVSVSTTPLPTAYNVGGGGSYCVGGTGRDVTLSNSDAGINYQLYYGSAIINSPVGGTGHPLDFGPQTAVGTYTVLATNAVTGCMMGMTGTATVTTTPLPTVYAVTGTGDYCAGGTGIAPGLAHSDVNVSYQLYLNGTAVGAAVNGTGSAISFAAQTTAGTYTVLATNTLTCVNQMSGGATISIDPLPTLYSVNGGGSYCAGGTGVHVGLSNSTVGISYQLYNNSTALGTPVTGTGAGLDFGLETAGGSYSVVATNNTTGCHTPMTGYTTVIVNPLPVQYAVTGGGGYCAGGTGVDVSLSGSELGITYQLFLNGTANGTAAAGTGTILNYGLRTVAGTYTIIANNGLTSCSAAMSGSAVISVNPLPAVYAMTGGGSYCAGGTGVHIGLVNSATGVNYQLYSGAVATGTAVAGNGAAIDFGLIATAGTYSVLATDATSGCTKAMSGIETVTINALPVVYAVTGGGSYCTGGAGVHIGLSSSEFGLSYQLYNGTAVSGVAVTGTGAALDFGLRTATGTYTIIATNPATTCTNTMSGSAAVSINPLPTVYAVTGGGAYCAGSTGVSVGLSGSNTGISYQLYDNGLAAGAAVAGSGTSISFGIQMAAGTYSVIATDGTSGCTNNMSGTQSVTINALPAVFAVSGGGGYCLGGTGVHVGLGSSVVGISYQLYNNSGTVGGLVPGTGNALDFGLQTAAGTYSVTASNVPAGCRSNMSGAVTVTVNPLPPVHNVTGGGAYCAGSTAQSIGLDGSETGINYMLYNGNSLVSTVAGAGPGAITFGPQVAAGSYSVFAVSASTGCSSNMNGTQSISINPLPTVYNVTGGGSFCTGGTGTHVGLDGSNTGITYKLYNAGTLMSTKAGTGSAIDFGLMTTTGTYTVTATDNITGCPDNMNSSAVITTNALPTAQTVTASGINYCAGGAGITIGLLGSQGGVKYQLYNGTSVTGSAVTGSGTSVTFGPQLAAGTYSVLATNVTTGCSAAMSGTAPVSVIALPQVYAVTGGGSYCIGSAGVDIALSNSEGASVTYGLVLAGTGTVAAHNGTNGVVDFGTQQWPAGTYTVIAANGSCNSNMSGTAVVVQNVLPTGYTVTVTNSGAYCTGGTGVSVGVAGSNTGISYQLYDGSGAPSGSAVTGTGAAISFGLRVATGNYTVIATDMTTGCTGIMNNFITISTNPLPVVYNVTGGGGYCAGTGGVVVGLDGSQSAATTYNLYNGTSATPVATQSGTNGAINFPAQPAGVYTIVATGGSSCVSTMAGSATVTQNPLPATFAVTGGGAYCHGGTGVDIGLGGSVSGVSYQLYDGAGTVGSAVAGTGNALDFGMQVAAGSYSVIATNDTTTCTGRMTGSATISINALPTAYTVTGGGSYCQGGGGVDVSVSGSDAGVSYQLYNGTVQAGAPRTGAGGINFGNQTAAGTYVVVATDNSTTHCVSNMTGSVTVSINTLPVAYNVVAAASSYCAGGTGVDVTLTGSETTSSYQLYVGTAPVGAAITGTGAALDFGLQPAPGTYKVIATNNTSGCTNNMATTAAINVAPLPTAFTITGGGSYCFGGTGVHIGLSGSESGIRYDIYNGSHLDGSVTGTGGAIDFGLQAAGGYLVFATNTATTCTTAMPGSAIVTVNALPTAYAMAGGGPYCAGTAGAQVSLAGSDTGVSYQLYAAGVATGTPMAGTGSALNFGLHAGTGNYTVVATNIRTGCVNNMSGMSVISLLSAPPVYTVTGGGSYCFGGTGVTIGLNGSNTGITYRLYNSSGLIASMSGTNAAISFGLQAAAGSYSVTATNSTSCVSTMSGSADVTVNPLPTAYSVTGGGSYCSGTAAPHVSLSSSATGIRYQLYSAGSTVGAAMSGTGHGLDFGAQATPGAYGIYAQNTTTGCTADMSGTVTVTENMTVVPSVTMITTPGDTVCAGTNVSFTALSANGGSGPSYNWTINGFSVSLLNNYNYVPTNGDVVEVTMVSSQVCATPATVSSSLVMTVSPIVTPAVSVSADLGDTVCAGTTVVFTANPTYGGTPTYTWMVGGATVGTGPTYTYAPALGDVIEVVMTSNYACRTASTVFSTPVTMTIDTPVTPIVSILASPGTKISQGQADTLTAVVPAVISNFVTLSYQWLINGVPVPGAIHQSFVNSNYNDMDSVTVEVTAISSCGNVSTFNSVIIYVERTGVTTVKGAAANITLVPNPNKGAFVVKGSLGTTASEEVTLELTDVLGQVIYRSKVMSRNGVIDEQVQLSGTVANGMYVLSVKTATDNKVFHVVVEQ